MNPYKEVAARLEIALESLKVASDMCKTLNSADHDEFGQWHCGLSMQVEAWRQKHEHQLHTKLRVVDPGAPLDGGSR